MLPTEQSRSTTSSNACSFSEASIISPSASRLRQIFAAIENTYRTRIYRLDALHSHLTTLFLYPDNGDFLSTTHDLKHESAVTTPGVSWRIRDLGVRRPTELAAITSAGGAVSVKIHKFQERRLCRKFQRRCRTVFKYLSTWDAWNRRLISRWLKPNLLKM